MGFTDAAPLNEHTARYLCGYTTKKLTNANDSYNQLFLKGRHPEFARMSTRPAIGSDALDGVAKEIQQDIDAGRLKDAPAGLMHGGKMMPLGKTLRNHLRRKLGIHETPQATKDEQAETVRELHEDTLDNPEIVSLKDALLEKSAGRRHQIEKRHLLYSKEKNL